MSTLCWLIEVIFLLEFYYLFIYLFIFVIVSYLGGMVSPCRYTQSSNKRINVEGCKNTIGSEPINKKEHKAVKQHSGPTIYLGKDNESKLIIDYDVTM